MDHDPLRRGFAEFVGTFALVFIGAGSILTFAKLFAPVLSQGAEAAGVYNGLGLVGVALAHGLAIGVMASAVGHISGGHFNPAVTLGFLVTRRITPALAGVYWVAQLAGAVAASLLVKWLFPGDALAVGVPAVNNAIGSGEAVVLEGILTFFLVFVIFATAFDPQLTGNHWADGWVWYVGPIVGAVVAAVAYEWLYLRPLAPMPVGPAETGVREPRPGDAAAS